MIINFRIGKKSSSININKSIAVIIEESLNSISNPDLFKWLRALAVRLLNIKRIESVVRKRIDLFTPLIKVFNDSELINEYNKVIREELSKKFGIRFSSPEQVLSSLFTNPEKGSMVSVMSINYLPRVLTKLVKSVTKIEVKPKRLTPYSRIIGKPLKELIIKRGWNKFSNFFFFKHDNDEIIIEVISNKPLSIDFSEAWLIIHSSELPLRAVLALHAFNNHKLLKKKPVPFIKWLVRNKQQLLTDDYVRLEYRGESFFFKKDKTSKKGLLYFYLFNPNKLIKFFIKNNKIIGTEEFLKAPIGNDELLSSIDIKVYLNKFSISSLKTDFKSIKQANYFFFSKEHCKKLGNNRLIGYLTNSGGRIIFREPNDIELIKPNNDVLTINDIINKQVKLTLKINAKRIMMLTSDDELVILSN